MNALVIVLRLIHIITAVLWVGGISLLAMFILPSIEMAGPIGGQFMQVVVQRTKLPKYLPSIGGLTVLSGFALFWRDMSVSGGSFAQSASGMTFSIGGLAGLIGLIVGSTMSTKSAKALGVLGATIAQSGGPPSAEQAAQIGALRARMKSGTNISLVLLLIATAAMAVARYV
jgi:hypothetical protein